MEMDVCPTPIIFMVFNRPETTLLVFRAIAAARPAKLLLIADGARAGKEGEDERCRQVREIVSRVDWPCEVFRNFADQNLGCGERVISGLDWAFSLVEEAVILEDDCLPDPSFFPFCSEMLERYRNDHRVAMIAGSNCLGPALKTEYSYFMSKWSHIWGWATWRTAWSRYDRSLSTWPEVKRSGILNEIFYAKTGVRFWTRIFDSMHDGTGPNTWDYQWYYTNLIQGSLSIVPSCNLIRNIGFGPDATHTFTATSCPSQEVEKLAFPLAHPPYVTSLRSMDILDQKIWGCRVPGLHVRITNKMRRMLGKLRSLLG